MKYMPSQLRPESGAHGISRWTMAPCHGTCAGDTHHVAGECLYCGASAPKQKVRVEHAGAKRRKGVTLNLRSNLNRLNP